MRRRAWTADRRGLKSRRCLRGEGASSAPASGGTAPAADACRAVVQESAWQQTDAGRFVTIVTVACTLNLASYALG